MKIKNGKSISFLFVILVVISIAFVLFYYLLIYYKGYIDKRESLNNIKLIEKIDLVIERNVSAYNRMKKKLVVVGEGPELGRLKDLAGSTIELIDWQPPEKLVGYYRGCRMLIFPGGEDFGIVPVEAMACGVPVIASDTTSLPEVCGGAAAALVSPTNHKAAAVELLKLENNEVWYKDRVEAGIKRASEFSWDKSALLLSRAIDEMLEDK
jgi:glycosyltransferase involved in cell wall biosynthesis